MIELFVSETCPYCRKVLTFFDENNIDYIKRVVSDSENFEKLMELGGINQVPFLYDKDKNIKMYESDDIIEYANKIGE